MSDRVPRNRWGKRLDFWRCRRKSIFCGGTYSPARRLCDNCDTREKRRGRRACAVRRATFTLTAERGSSRQRRNGIRLRIKFPARLFVARRTIYVDYGRWLWERVTGERLQYEQVVVNVSRKLRPDFEDLLIMARGRAPQDAALMLYLAEQDARAEQSTTPF